MHFTFLNLKSKYHISLLIVKSHYILHQTHSLLQAKLVTVPSPNLAQIPFPAWFVLKSKSDSLNRNRQN